MKTFTLAILIALFAPLAFATPPGNNGNGNGGCGVGQQTNGCGGSSATGGSSTSGAAALAGAAALSVSASNATGGKSSSTSHSAGGDAAATGGSATGGSAAGGQASSGGNSISTGNGDTYMLPAPVVTVAPQSSGGIVTKSHAVGLLWNAVSWSKSEQSTDTFVGGERLVADYERLCQYETAAMLRGRLYALLDPAYRELPAQPGVRNLTPDECRATRR